MSLDDRRKATIYAVPDCADVDRDRVHILPLGTDVSREISLGAILGNSRIIAGEAGRCSVIRMIKKYQYGEYCNEKNGMNLVIVGAFTAHWVFSMLSLAVEDMG